MPKKKLITSALPYVNNEPHLGNIIGCVLSADVFARYCRLREYETLYICGNDEYGTATETKAREEGLTPKEICDKYHEIHKKIYKHFNISFDAFGRTSTETHKNVVQDIFKLVKANGFFIEKVSEQYYSESQGKFLADRLINGICPKCGYEDARGDQCDSCGSLLNPIDLINPRCAIDGKPLILKETNNLYLNLPILSEQLERFQNRVIDEGFWPNNAATTTQSWMKRGLEPRAITRDLKWGIPVPDDNFLDKVFYVWFDAPIGYISITKEAFADTWQKWWLTPKDTELYQFMAKDNIPFHSVIFPATQIASGQDWTKVFHLSSTEYLNYEDTKFSKSRNIGVFGTDVINSDIPVDLWRFYLLSIRPEKNDSAFTWQEFFDKVNSEFIDNIGNLVNRTLVYSLKNFDGEFYKGIFNERQSSFLKEAKDIELKITSSFEKVELRESLRLLLLIGNKANKFFQDEEPWAKIKDNKDEVFASITALLLTIKDLAILLSPFMPETAEKIASMIGLKNLSWSELGNFDCYPNLKIKSPEILYKKLDTKLVNSFKEQFSGHKKDNPWEKISLKSGKIVEITRHPKADHLYIEKIDLGEGRLRTIVSGLVEYFKEDEILNKNVLVAVNLKPVELTGIISEGMVLCASKKKKMEIVSTLGTAIGSIAYRAGENICTPKIEISIEEFKNADIRTVNGVLMCGGKELMLDNITLKTTIILNSKIS